MALPSSGKLSYGDIRSETQMTGRTPFSVAKAAWTTGSYTLLQYAPINVGANPRPNVSQPATVTEWYGYNHTVAIPCDTTVTNLGARTKPQSPYGDFYVIDVGTVSGDIDWYVTINQTSSFGASIAADYGYPWDSSGNYVGGAGGLLFGTGLINSNTSGSATYTYNASYGSKIYLSIDAIQSSTSWPTFDIALTCTYSPPTFSNFVSFLENSSTAACSASPSIYIWGYNSGLNNGDTYYVGTIVGPTQPLQEVAGGNLYYSNGTNWIQINGSGVAISAGSCPTPTPTPTPTATNTPTPTATNTPTPTPTIAYNYYEFTPCTGGSPIYYRSILALGLGDVYAFQASPPDRICYEITDINASPTNDDLPTIYGKTDCLDPDCIQL